MMIMTRGDHFRFGSVFINKSNQTEFFFFEKKTETGSNRPVSVRFFMAKTGSNQFGSVFSVFSVWLGFFSGFLSVSVRFGSVRFFRFFAYKTETEPAGFFKNLIGLIGFFFGSVFSVIFFSVFLV
jgi:hypothetical protein